MSEAEYDQISLVMETTAKNPHDTARRRNGLGYIFEQVDVSMLMERLNLKASHRVYPCSSCFRVACGGKSSGARPSPASEVPAVPRPKVEGSLLSCSDCAASHDVQCESEEEERCNPRHSKIPSHPHAGHTGSLCRASSEENLELCPAAGTNLTESSSSAVDPLDGSASNSSIVVPESERARSSGGGGGGGQAVIMEDTDNCHTVRGFRPEVCAKRSILF